MPKCIQTMGGREGGEGDLQRHESLFGDLQRHESLFGDLPLEISLWRSKLEPNGPNPSRLSHFWEKLGDQFARENPKIPRQKGLFRSRFFRRLISFERPSNELKVNFVRGPRDTQKSSKSDGFYRWSRDLRPSVHQGTSDRRSVREVPWSSIEPIRFWWFPLRDSKISHHRYESNEPNRFGSFWNGTAKLGDQFRSISQNGPVPSSLSRIFRAYLFEHLHIIYRTQ